MWQVAYGLQAAFQMPLFDFIDEKSKEYRQWEEYDELQCSNDECVCKGFQELWFTENLPEIIQADKFRCCNRSNRIPTVEQAVILERDTKTVQR